MESVSSRKIVGKDLVTRQHWRHAFLEAGFYQVENNGKEHSTVREHKYMGQKHKNIVYSAISMRYHVAKALFS